MAADDTETGDKQHEPTQRKLDEARKKGDVVRSADLNTAAGYGGLLVTGLAYGPSAVEQAGVGFSALVARADELSAGAFSGADTAFLGTVLKVAVPPFLPFLLVPMGAVLLSAVAQRALVVALSKLEPKLSRISPIAIAKQKFGRAGLFEFAKSFVKLLIYGAILTLFLWRRLPDLVQVMSGTPAQVSVYLLQLCLQFLSLVLVVALILGAVDYLWQRVEHMRRNRMSHKDLMDEHKQAEGDPHVKQQRRQRGQEIAMNRMLADVPTASVVVVNPTHYAVALKWERGQVGAPVCVAKGVDEIAARIRERAEEAGVPIRRDPPTARALFDTVEIGAEIRPEHYAAIAAAIRFAEDIRRKARAR